MEPFSGIVGMLFRVFNRVTMQPELPTGDQVFAETPDHRDNEFIDTSPCSGL